ncbi:adenine phosphoribosyltransferase-like isoform X1 [Ptychodera flava]|uniref:adenine phosphoribosyltransferase-like isoform X1 n=1 Tax=Ptychodera flava TaxID=63121 RepID=UPI00396A3BC5
MTSEYDLEKIKQIIKSFPDFPKPGIMFRDIFPVFRNPKALEALVDYLVDAIKTKAGEVDIIIGLEARGFILGPMIAVKLGAAFAPIRKKGKLPGKCIQVSYSLHYGQDVFEAQEDAVKEGQKVVIVDDVLATGGTMSAAGKLVSQMGGELKLGLVVIELDELNGKSRVSFPVHSLIHF